MDVTHNKTFVIGLTGGIGSGKTTIANNFADLGACIIDADKISHQLTQLDQPAFKPITEHFGNTILNTDKTINRQALRKIIFSNPNEKKWLENLLHPMIRQTMQTQINNCDAPYCICVIPLLAESSGIDFLDRVLVIETPLSMQRQRAALRDKSNKQSIQNIINSQASAKKRRAIADDIIQNNGTLASLQKKNPAITSVLFTTG